MTETIITRAVAKAQGFSRYFTGKPCKRGHVVERRTSGGNCVRCWADWCAQHSSEMSAYRKQWEEENKLRLPEMRRRWRADNPEKSRASTKKWQDAHPRKVLERTRRWGRLNPEKIAAKDSRRRGRERGASGSHTASDLRAILARQNNRCVYCSADFAATGKHIDHILPLILGGSNWPENIQYLCPPCNLAKAAKHPADFEIEREITLARRSQEDGKHEKQCVG